MKLNFVLGYTKNGKHFATTTQRDTAYNLLGAFDSYEHDEYLGDLVIIHYASSKKKAEELAKSWNEAYTKNGTILQY